jgi:hypothetical protein
MLVADHQSPMAGIAQVFHRANEQALSGFHRA